MDNSETGGIDSSGNIISGDNLWKSNVYIEVEPNTTYTLSRKIFNDNLSRVIRLYEYDNNKTFISPRKESSTESLTITTTANTKYLKWTIFELNATLTKSAVQAWLLQLELGTATTYTVHQQQTLPLTLGNIELCKIGDYQDYFYKASNKWYLHKEIGKVVLDGSQTINKNSSDTSNYLYYINLSDHLTGGNVISNKLTIKSLGQLNGDNSINNVGISILNSNKIIYFNIGYYLSTNTVAGVSAYLTENNITIYYILETPTDTEITDTTLISQLEAINNAISYEEQINISSNTIALFSVEAYQSTKLVLKEMATAIVALGGV